MSLRQNGSLAHEHQWSFEREKHIPWMGTATGGGAPVAVADHRHWCSFGIPPKVTSGCYKLKTATSNPPPLVAVLISKRPLVLNKGLPISQNSTSAGPHKEPATDK